jgi:hypothetical protein
MNENTTYELYLLNIMRHLLKPECVHINKNFSLFPKWCYKITYFSEFFS